MATVDERIKGKTDVGEVFTELRIVGKRTRVIVQSTGIKTKHPDWFVYLLVPGKKGSVKTLAAYKKFETAEKFAYNYVRGM